jgi:hypothetical protein
MNGWMSMNYRHSLILLLMIQFSSILQAVSEQDNGAPSLDLLEFLGEWESSDGEWLDPAEFEDNDFAKLIESTHDVAFPKDQQRYDVPSAEDQNGWEEDE